jgi:hypothetical protein
MVVSAILGAAIALAVAAGVSVYRQSLADQAARAELARVNQAAIAMHVASERAENPVIAGPFAMGIPATSIDRQVAAHLASERAENSAALAVPFAVTRPVTANDLQMVQHNLSERADTATFTGTPVTANDRQVVQHNQSERSE